MKKLIVLLFIGIASSAKAQENLLTTDRRLTGLDTAINRTLALWSGPGIAVAVIEKNKIVYAKGFGYRDLENKKPVTANTLFAIGSCTKAFTVALIGELDGKGSVDIDKPVRDYLPELKFYNDDMNNRITLRDMMCHRTGLPRHDYSWYLFTTQSRDSLLGRIKYLEPSAKPNEKWQYNNFMFLAQGMVIEKITHASWESNIKSNIFQPLGMNRSNMSIADLEKDSNSAKGYRIEDSSAIRRVKKMDYYSIDAMGPAGSINSSVWEMSNWLNTWIHGGKFIGSEIFPVSFAKEAISSQMIIDAGFPALETKDIQFSNYGFGWTLASYRGHYRAEHGGNIDGFSASTCFFPGDSIGIVVLVNQNNSAIPSIIRNLVADRMLGLKYFNWCDYTWKLFNKAKKDQESAESARVSDSRTPAAASHPYADYTGFFNNPGYGTLNIFQEHDSLFVGVAGSTAWMKHNQFDWFTLYRRDKEGRVDTTEGVPLEFRTNQLGAINELNTTLEPAVKPLIFSRIIKPADLTADNLKKYEGEYLIGPVTLKVSLENNALHLTVPGQPEYTLVPIDSKTFGLKDLSGFTITFDSNEKNVVTGLTSTQPNGTFKATKKQKD